MQGTGSPYGRLRGGYRTEGQGVRPEGEGYGKAILIGEHFVVHGARGIGIGIPKNTTVMLKRAPVLRFAFEFGETLKDATRRILEMMVASTAFEVYVESELPPSAGMGWSAAYCVALARAAAKSAGRELSNREAAEIAFEGEKVFHGNPSGIDNTLAAFGGAMLFSKGHQPKQLAVGKRLHFVIANSGKKGPTKDLVDKVLRIKERRPAEFRRMMEAEERIVDGAIEALAKGERKKLGRLMNRNNALLERLGLSTPNIDEIRKTALENGALGAKITGAGGGGGVLILAPDMKRAKRITKKLKYWGAFNFSVG